MKKFGNRGRIVRTDQGGELARSSEFKTVLESEFGYIVEPTGADNPSQNGGSEIYNDKLAVKTRTLLYQSNLPPNFWSSVVSTHTLSLSAQPSSSFRDKNDALS